MSIDTKSNFRTKFSNLDHCNAQKIQKTLSKFKLTASVSIISINYRTIGKYKSKRLIHFQCSIFLGISTISNFDDNECRNKSV